MAVARICAPESTSLQKWVGMTLSLLRDIWGGLEVDVSAVLDRARRQRRRGGRREGGGGRGEEGSFGKVGSLQKGIF